MENSLDKSKLHTVPSMLTVFNEPDESSAFPPTVGPLLPYSQIFQLYVSYILIFSILPDSSVVCNTREGLHAHSHWVVTVCLALAANDPFPMLHLGSQGSHFQNPLRKHFANSNTV